MAELLKSKAIILHSIRWQESSKIVSLYSEKLGKLKVIARGALRNKSPFAGKLESLNLIEAIVSNKESRSLQILTDVDLINSFNHIRLQLDRLPYALAILEIINQVFEDYQPEAIFFDFTVTMLTSIEVAPRPEIIFCYFLLKLSSFLGFKPNFEKCQSCGTNQFNYNVYFSIENGVVYCADCAQGSHISHKIEINPFRFLQHLQKYNHRKIINLTPQDSINYDFISLMIEYLNFHLEQTINLKALSMLNYKS